MRLVKFVLIVIISMLVNNIYSQNSPKQEFCETFCFDGEDDSFFNCINEPVLGEIEFCWTWFTDKKYQYKVKGELTGIISGKAYEISEVLNTMWIQKSEHLFMDKNTQTLSVTSEGIEIGVIHHTWKATYNSVTFESTVEIDKWIYKCND